MRVEQRQQQFQFAYIRAVASAAGFKVTEDPVDDDSVDLTISAGKSWGTSRRPKVDLQAKCIYCADYIKADGIHYPLSRKNYDDLRLTDLSVPRILVAMTVPSGDPKQWLESRPTDRELIIKGLGYWGSIRGFPALEANQTQKTVVIPFQQEFSVDILTEIMRKINRKEAL